VVAIVISRLSWFATTEDYKITDIAEIARDRRHRIAFRKFLPVPAMMRDS